jgi:cation:H+ antiporter
MIPIAFSLARGQPAALPFDGAQRDEILLTLAQSGVAVLLLLNLRFEWWNAAALFALWLTQFLVPGWRVPVAWAYAGWAAALVLAWPWRRPTAPRALWRLLRQWPVRAGDS